MEPMLPLAEFQLGPFAIEYPDTILATILGFALAVLLLWKVNIPGSVPYFRDILKERHGRISDTHNQVEAALADMKS